MFFAPGRLDRRRAAPSDAEFGFANGEAPAGRENVLGTRNAGPGLGRGMSRFRTAARRTMIALLAPLELARLLR